MLLRSTRRGSARMAAAVTAAVILLLALLLSAADAAAPRILVKASCTKTLTVPVGGTAAIELVLTPKVTVDVVYTSRNPSIATVDQAGTVKGVRVGKATVSTKLGGRTFLTSVKVVKATVPASPTAAPTPVPTQATTLSVPGKFLSVGDELKLLNARRAKAGLGALSICDELLTAAQTRAYESSKSFGHTRPNGKSALDLVSDTVPSAISTGENLAMAKGPQSTDASFIVGLWMDSPGHRANILRSTFTHIAMAAYQAPDGAVYWSQLFAGF